MHIFVGNICGQATAGQLKKLFTPFGNIQFIRIVTDIFTSRSRGIGFIEMPESAGALRAIEMLNNSSFQGQVIEVRAVSIGSDGNLYGSRRY